MQTATNVHPMHERVGAGASELIRLWELNVELQGRVILEHVDLSIRKGELICVVGALLQRQNDHASCDRRAYPAERWPSVVRRARR